MKASSLYEKELWALTPEALIEVDELVALGWDRDLAIACVTQIYPEDELYDLGEGKPNG